METEVIRELSPGSRFHRSSDGQLFMTVNGEAIALTLKLCFPWSDRNGFISLRDSRGQERLLIKKLSDLSASESEVIEAALSEGAFILRIRVIREVEEMADMRRWIVETDRGPRTFYTRLASWPVRPGAEAPLHIEDAAGDLYEFPPFGELDAKSQKLLWPLVD